jgi:transcriptional regulator with XRE-family HTH domain
MEETSGQKLRKSRQAAELPFAGLSRLSGVNAQRISRLEGDKVMGNMVDQWRLAMALKVEPTEIWPDYTLRRRELPPSLQARSERPNEP